MDYITFSGSGEPTLHKGIGTLICAVKKLTTIPVAVITNSSLLSDAAVHDALMNADLVVPSLDAGTEETFQSINRPHDAIRFNDMVTGLARFSEAFSGQLWLEIMLVRGVNDSDQAVEALYSRLAEIRPRAVQLNTVFRPPAEETAHAVDGARLQRIREKLGSTASIVTEFRGNMQDTSALQGEQRILEFIRRRPATASDLEASLGMHRNEVVKYLVLLEKQGHIKQVAHEERTYYEPV
jgi:wyosine [tRNA(Phe)-imidazoG37] synthetase (radical SAM superfamily)